MKKIIITFIILLMTCVAFAQDAVYRVSSNEVLKIGSISETFEQFLAVKTGASFPNGTDTKDPNGDHRVFGYSKIVDGDVIRNATQIELDTFRPAAIDDRNQFQTTQAVNYFKNDPNFRRIMIAFAAILVNEINILRAEHALSDRTLEQLKTAIENRISKDD